MQDCNKLWKLIMSATAINLPHGHLVYFKRDNHRKHKAKIAVCRYTKIIVWIK